MRILVADDHALIREGLRMVLRQFDASIDCVDAFDGASVKRALAEHPDIDLVLLDRRLPDCDGMSLMQQLLDTHPTLPIVMLSAEFDAGVVSQAIELGAAGFIPKTSVTTVLVSALRLVLAGGVYVPPEVLRRDARRPGPVIELDAHAAAPESLAAAPGADDLAEAPADRAAQIGLTDRQIDVLALLMEGMSNKQISRELDLAEATVKVHVRSILRVLDASSRTEAVVAASRLGLRPENMRRGEPTGR